MGVSMHINSFFMLRFKVACLLNSLTTYFDVKTTIELFAYLGYNNYYDESQISAFNGN